MEMRFMLLGPRHRPGGIPVQGQQLPPTSSLPRGFLKHLGGLCAPRRGSGGALDSMFPGSSPSPANA